MPFKKIGLCDELVQGILATGYTAPTEIQAEAIPIAIAGKDMIGCAQTGTGKTAAFVLPILNRIAGRSGKKKLRSLVVTPTRELAMQIDKSIKGYGRFTRVKSLAVYGGSPIDKQIKFIKTGVDIIAATPGRLIDLMNRGVIDLSSIEVLVLDEADRMLDMGFINDIKKIIAKTPKERQTLLFSATMSKEVQTLTKTIQRSPKMIQIGITNNPIDTITQHMYPVSREQKMELLLYMMNRQQMYSVLIFSRTKRGADKICKKLKQNGIKAEAIHSDRSMRQRLRALEGFKRGTYQVMVATDIAARGINVEGISHVFNYDVPGYAEDYVHRIGRTGRAEATGDAITFVSQDEIGDMRKIERFIDRKFNDEYYDGFEYGTRFSVKTAPMGAGTKKGGGRGRTASGAGGGRGRSGGQGGKSKSYGKKKSAGAGQGGGSKYKSGTYAKKKSASSSKSGGAKSGQGKGGAGAKSKKSFKKKAKSGTGGAKAGGGSFKRSKKKSAKKSNRRP
ncbi:MAG: DEAD/DEAH box helicase [Planctomycetes bacterium]|nr:DEAD/DEAH box helicase [Planctomycetota bacterium]